MVSRLVLLSPPPNTCPIAKLVTMVNKIALKRKKEKRKKRDALLQRVKARESPKSQEKPKREKVRTAPPGPSFRQRLLRLWRIVHQWTPPIINIIVIALLSGYIISYLWYISIYDKTKSPEFNERKMHFVEAATAVITTFVTLVVLISYCIIAQHPHFRRRQQ